MHPHEFVEDEVTTIQGPQHRTIQGPPHWYPIPLPLHYKATSKHGMVLGFGQTRMMSSQDIIFAAGDGLKPGMEAQIALAWPFLLDNRVPLQLVLDTTITGTQDGVAEARILAHHFRTRRAAEVSTHLVLAQRDASSSRVNCRRQAGPVRPARHLGKEPPNATAPEGDRGTKPVSDLITAALPNPIQTGVGKGFRPDHND
jgi:hypothetical protein